MNLDERAPDHRIRIAQQGWQGVAAARSIEDVQIGRGLAWVEIDGVRITGDRLTSITVEADTEGFAVPVMHTAILGAVEWVYLGADGEELHSRHATIDELAASSPLAGDTVSNAEVDE